MNSVVFLETFVANLHDRMDAEYLHPQRVETIQMLKELENDGRIEIVKLGSLLKPYRKKLLEPKPESVQCIELKDIEVDYGLAEPRTISTSDAGTSIWRCEGGQILFSKLRPYLNKVTLLPAEVDQAICSNEFLVLSRTKVDVPIGYVWMALRSEWVLNQSRHLHGGSLRPRNDEHEILDIDVPLLANKGEMKKIDDNIMEAVARYYPAIRRLNAIPKLFLQSIRLPPPSEPSGVFFKMAEDQSDSPRSSYRMDPLFFHPGYYSDLKKNLESWSKSNHGEVRRLKTLCIPEGIWKPKVKLAKAKGEIPRLGVNNITGLGISWDCEFVEIEQHQEKHVLRPMDILITSTGTGSAGRVDIYIESQPSITDGETTIIRVNSEVKPFYLLAYLRTEYARRQLARMERGSSGQIHLYPHDIDGILVPFSFETSVVKSIDKEARESYQELLKVKNQLRRMGVALMDGISGTSGSSDEGEAITSIPSEKWRIKR